MDKQEQKLGIIVALIVLSAILCRVITKLGILCLPLGITRSLLYMALYLVWGISVNRRILQSRVRYYMLAVSALCVFWFLVRSIKYFLVVDPDFVRGLWYCYYFPMLYIPLLAVFISVSLGKPETYQLPRWVRGLYIPTLFLLLAVLTNDWHQFVFAFPPGEVWSDKNYSYALGYYLVFGWEVACALMALGIMLVKCRLAQKKKYMPVLLMGISIGYAVIYASGATWMQVIGGDIAAVQCLFFVGILESCIACGLIPTNTGYVDLFMVSRIGAQIIDRENIVHLSSTDAKVLTGDQRLRVKRQPLLVDKRMLIKSKPIKFGQVLWQEDVSDLITIIDQLEENCRNLSEMNRIQAETLETEKKTRALQEKNRVTDLIHLETARQMEFIDRLLKRYDAETDVQKCRRLLAGVAVLGAYIKRYSNLLLVNEGTEIAHIRDLARCFEESFINLKLLGVDCLCRISSDILLHTEEVIRLYRTFETVLEDCLFTLDQVWVYTRVSEGQVFLIMDFVCDKDLSHHRSAADCFSEDDESSRFIFHLRKGVTDHEGSATASLD
ncbi:hypothetical protein ACLGL1_09165 [Peptococcus simiae]|uniref:hypothetical protein n=1 Tax=Peptococcus simiae TaxID=1643805 RepID=UPI00397F41DC